VIEPEPLVSVVIPTFNRKEMLTRAIESVLGQTYRHLELIVVDDGSTDGTGTYIEKYRNDNRFIYSFQENRGQSSARNNGILRANGEIIAFLDSDNYWHKDKLRRQIDFWNEHTGFDILYSDGHTIDLDGNIIPTSTPITKRPSGSILKTLMAWNCVTNNTVLVPKRCFMEMDMFNESLRIAEDYDLWLRYATRYTFIFHPEKVSYYCVEGERLSAQEERNIDVNFQILESFKQRFPTAVSGWVYRKAIGNLMRWRIESRWNSGVKPTFDDIGSSIIHNPFDFRCWKHFFKYLVS